MAVGSLLLVGECRSHGVGGQMAEHLGAGMSKTVRDSAEVCATGTKGERREAALWRFLSDRSVFSTSSASSVI